VFVCTGEGRDSIFDLSKSAISNTRRRQNNVHLRNGSGDLDVAIKNDHIGSKFRGPSLRTSSNSSGAVANSAVGSETASALFGTTALSAHGRKSGGLEETGAEASQNRALDPAAGLERESHVRWLGWRTLAGGAEAGRADSSSAPFCSRLRF
jgi:hypothetical protein